MAENGISHKQTAAIGALLVHRTQAEAAAAAGVSPRQLSRWLTEDAGFRAALAEAEAAIVDHTARRLTQATMAALDTVIRIMETGSSDSVKLRAAVSLLDTTLRWHELRVIEQRLSALESAYMPTTGEGK